MTAVTRAIALVASGTLIWISVRLADQWLGGIAMGVGVMGIAVLCAVARGSSEPSDVV